MTQAGAVYANKEGEAAAQGSGKTERGTAMSCTWNEERDAAIRSNWGVALAMVDDGTQLSQAIGWGFDDADIETLFALYKAGKHQQKILDLLEDCNFHSEVRELLAA